MEKFWFVVEICWRPVYFFGSLGEYLVYLEKIVDERKSSWKHMDGSVYWPKIVRPIDNITILSQDGNLYDKNSDMGKEVKTFLQKLMFPELF